MTEANKYGLLWLETCLNGIIAHCSDKDTKTNLIQCKKSLIKAIDCAFRD